MLEFGYDGKPGMNYSTLARLIPSHTFEMNIVEFLLDIKMHHR